MAKGVLLCFLISELGWWLKRFFHNVIRQGDIWPDYLLFFNYVISSVKKERLCSDGSMRGYFAYLKSVFQFIADSGGNPLALIVLVDIKSVKVACFVNIAKPCYDAAFYGNKWEMLG